GAILTAAHVLASQWTRVDGSGMSSRDASVVEFHGTARYQTQTRLGAGAMGVVYRVVDRETGQLAALKRLKRLDGEAIYRFKREFRALADVSHANLVSLYE